MIYLLPLAMLVIFWVISQRILVVTRRSARPLQNPYTWFVSFWVLQFLLLSLPLLEYETPTTFFTLVYILLSHVAFLVGMTFALVFNKHARTMDFARLPARREIYYVFAGAGLIGQGGLSLSLVMSNTVDLSSRFTREGYEAARYTQLYDGGYEFGMLGGFSGLFVLMAALGYIALAYYCFYRGVGARWTRTRSISTVATVTLALMIAADGIILTGGRSQVFFLLALMTPSFFLGRAVRRKIDGQRPPRTNVKAIVAGVVAGIALFLGSVSFQQFRSNDRDPRFDLWYAEGARAHELIAPEVERSAFVGNLLVQVGYFTSSSNILDFYMRERDFPGPFYGRYNFPTVYRSLGRFLPGYDRDFWERDRAELFAPLISRGRLGNVWSSLFRDFAADFGLIGALIALVVMGWGTQRASDLFFSRPDPFRAILLTLLCFLGAASALLSLFFIPVFTWALPLLIVLVVSEWGLGRARARAAPPRLGFVPATVAISRTRPRRRIGG